MLENRKHPIRKSQDTETHLHALRDILADGKPDYNEIYANGPWLVNAGFNLETYALLRKAFLKHDSSTLPEEYKNIYKNRLDT